MFNASFFTKHLKVVCRGYRWAYTDVKKPYNLHLIKKIWKIRSYFPGRIDRVENWHLYIDINKLTLKFAIWTPVQVRKFILLIKKFSSYIRARSRSQIILQENGVSLKDGIPEYSAEMFRLFCNKKKIPPEFTKRQKIPESPYKVEPYFVFHAFWIWNAIIKYWIIQIKITNI